MESRLCKVVLCVAVASLMFGCAAKYDTLMPSVQSNYAGVTSAQQTWSIYVPEAGTDVQAQVAFKAPNKLKAELTYPITASAVSDGKTLAVCVPDYNTCVNLKLDAETEFVPPRVLVKLFTPQATFVDLATRYAIKQLDVEEDAGTKLVVFELTPKDAAAKIGTAKMWVEADRPVVAKVEVYDKTGVCKSRTSFGKYVQQGNAWMPQEYKIEQGDGSPLINVTVTDIKVNQDIPDSTFVFNAPSNMVVLDQVPPLGGGMPDLLFFE